MIHLTTFVQNLGMNKRYDLQLSVKNTQSFCMCEVGTTKILRFPYKSEALVLHWRTQWDCISQQNSSWLLPTYFLMFCAIDWLTDWVPVWVAGLCGATVTLFLNAHRKYCTSHVSYYISWLFGRQKIGQTWMKFCGHLQ